jgi:hypothetical protein
MQDTQTDCSFIYIIEIPVDVVMKDDKLGKFAIVQVGSGSVGAQGLKKRMREHFLAWHYATGKPSKISKPKARPEDFTVENIAVMEGIIGVLSRTSSGASDADTDDEDETDDDDGDAVDFDDNIAESEAFVRELVGVRLRTSLIRNLLTQPFESSWGGRTVLDKGKHFSITELRLVSEGEVRLCVRRLLAANTADNVLCDRSSINSGNGSPLNGKTTALPICRVSSTGSLVSPAQPSVTCISSSNVSTSTPRRHAVAKVRRRKRQLPNSPRI